MVEEDDTTTPRSETIYWGNAKTSQTHTQLLLGGTEGEELVATLIEKRNLVKLAQLWVHGVSIDWSLLYAMQSETSAVDGAPQRIALPSYPFAGERFWLPGRPNLRLTEMCDQGGGARHPLLDGIDAQLSLERGHRIP